jgi:hypothetical protein
MLDGSEKAGRSTAAKLVPGGALGNIPQALHQRLIK